MTHNQPTIENLQRQLDIEVALERVRDCAIAMESSDELSEVLSVLFQQFDVLGIGPKTAWLTLWNPEDQTFTYRSTGTSGLRIQGQQVLDIDGMDIWKELYEKWKTDTSDSVEVLFYAKEDLQQLFSLLEETFSAMPEEERLTPEHFPDGGYSVQGHCKFGYIGYTHTREPIEEEKVILSRFATEFGRVYQRFLHLQKAEAQAREARIEASLERIRARAMAMQESTELTEVLSVIFQQLKWLGVDTVWAHMTLVHLEENAFTYRMTGRNGERIMAEEKIDLDASEHWSHISDAVKDPDKVPDPITRFEVPREGLEAIWELFDGIFSRLPEGEKVSPGDFPNGLYTTQAYCKFGFLGLNQTREATQEEADILLRFTTEFARLYQRFFDLQDAEESAREARIEAALERVRSRTMAMRNSEDVAETVLCLFDEIQNLGLDRTIRCGIGIPKSDKQWEIWSVNAQQGEEVVFRTGLLNFAIHPMLEESHKAWEDGDPVYSHEFFGEDVIRYYEALNNQPEYEFNADLSTLPDRQYFNGYYFKEGTLFSFTENPLTEEAQRVLERFNNLFGQTYRRYLDLLKAEAQAREAQIEAALERVRSTSMAMHRSEELNEVIRVIFDQLTSLDIHAEHAGIVVDYEAGGDWTFWVAEEQDIPSRITVPFLDSLWDRQYSEAKEKGTDFYTTLLDFEEKNAFYGELLKYIPGLTKKARDFYLSCPGLAISTVVREDIGLYIENFSGTPYSDEENAILKRFGSVFQQTYTRFLDLQKAEKQAREAEIEAALERVRSRTMAMHNSQDVANTVATLFREVMKLGLDDSIRCGIGILEGNEGMETWSANLDVKGEVNLKMGMLNMTIHPMLKGLKKAWEKGEKSYTYEFIGEDVRRYYTALNNEMEYPLHIEVENLPEKHYAKTFFYREGILFAFTDHPLTEEANRVLTKFANVFGQTYRRYLDLLKAEAQAREAQIEAALERVRARTMAMHKSEELGEVAAVLFEQIDGLGATLERLNIGVVREEEEIIEWWSTEQGGRQIDHLFKGSIYEPTTISKVYTAWKDGLKKLELDQTGTELQQWIKYVTEVIGLPFDPELIQGRRVHSAAFFKHGALLVSTPEPLPQASMNLLERFSAVFDQTYTRFLDLQKAEQQAREAEIEAALERVRAKTMAMHNTDDIAETVVAFFEELIGLGLDESMRVGIGILSQSEDMQLWTASIPDRSETILHKGVIDMSKHPLTQGVSRAWASGDRFFTYTLEGTDLLEYFKVMNDAPEYTVHFDLEKLPKKVHHYSVVFGDGVLYAFTEQSLPPDIRNTLDRFGAVFGQTYTRYLDLQKAEERAREAVKQASIERIRGEIASMRSTADLERITPLIWNELTALGVPFFRCGVFIVDKKEKRIHSYLSNPEGESLAVWQVSFGLIPVFDDMVKSWQKQEVFRIEWDRQGFLDFSQLLIEHGLVDDQERYQSGKDAPEHLVLHMLPFAQGMLYVGSQAHLGTDQMELVQSLANAFSVAYARYEDFNQLEKTLSDLKATQAQLIQSEKMASLGELTAGIAHEIKNPLNFVNNFSEVSRELLEELMEEMEKGDLEEVRALAGDVMHNLDKIVHHGQRADGIVRGMLQHSRSGDGKKEPTDLNELADEYLRLAYHGLRAKDKSFNAVMETKFDGSLGKVNVVPQDIGRVLLNLLTNAFHAINERKATAPDGYDPTVWVQTRKNGNEVEITVRDNGGGIPEKIRDKIFQPFFTTKPTGQGTGLGLSLSYDIVKAHGGELSVATEEGKGTTFFIKFKSTS